jgi:hypothetical protein
MPGNVAVRFSVQDQEVVRKALEDLGEQGKQALKKMDDASKTPSAAMKTLSNIVDEVKGRMVGLAVPLGPVGSGLIALGPGGLVAAAGIGAAITAMAKLAELTGELATKSTRISNFSEITGLTTDQVQALGDATQKYGKSQEDTNSVIERAVQAWDQLRRGQGDAYEQIRKIDPELLNQLTSAKSIAGALDVLSKAYSEAADEAAKLALARSFGGKSGASTLAALLGGIDDAGGIANLTKEAKEAGSVIDKELIQRLSTLQAQVNSLREKNKDTFASFFGDRHLQQAKEIQEDTAKILSGLKAINDYIANSAISDDNLKKFFGGMANGFRELSSNTYGGAGFGKRSGREGDLDNQPAVRVVIDTPNEPTPMPRARPAGAPTGETGAVPLAVQLRNMRDLVGLLGSAATSTEQYNLKELELRKSVEDGAISQTNANRALAAFKMASDQAIEGTRERLGIATQDNILTSRMAQLRDAQAKGIIQSAEEFARAENLVQREAQQTAEALEVRNSKFRGLKQLEIDGRDLSKSLDTGLTGSLNNIESGLTDIASAQVSVSDGSKNMVQTVGRSLEQMIIRMVFTANIAKALGSVLNSFGIGSGSITLGNSTGPTPFASADGNVFAGGNVVPFADGGIVRRMTNFMMANGKPASAAERNEEGILPLARINGKLGVYSAGGGAAASTQVNVNVMNYGNDNVDVKQKPNANGGIDMQVMIGNAAASEMAKPGSALRRVTDNRAPVAKR